MRNVTTLTPMPKSVKDYLEFRLVALPYIESSRDPVTGKVIYFVAYEYKSDRKKRLGYLKRQKRIKETLLGLALYHIHQALMK